jgi:flagellar biosynthetic protein FliQ
MSPADVLEVMRSDIVVALKMAAPVMLIGLGVGLVISLFQALTQIQEMTLAFVPKILVIFLSLLLLGSFMLNTLMLFAREMFSRIAGTAI